MAADHKILEIVLDIKDAVSDVSSRVATMQAQMDQHVKSESELKEKVERMDRQITLVHGAIAFIALLGTIAGIVKSLS